MIKREEISSFKLTHQDLEKKMESIDEKEPSLVVDLSEQLKELIDDMESTREREKSLWNPDISTKIKVVKKGARLFKKLQYFEIAVAKEFEKGHISQDSGKRFMAVTTLIKDNKMALAKKEFEYFIEIIELSKKYQLSRDEMEKKEKILTKEQHRIEKLLLEMSWLEKQRIDEEKATSYRQLLDNLEKLERLRSAYLSFLASEPITVLLADTEAMSHLPELPEKNEMDEIKRFFSDYPELGQYNISQICEMSDFSDKKLSHACPETTRFRRLITEHKKLFEDLNALERTSFLAADDENEKTLDFFAENVEGAKDIVSQIRLLRKGKLSCKEEYEKKKRYEEKKKELSRYSKDSLEKQLDEIKNLLIFLHSAPEQKEEGGDPLSKILSFFRSAKHT